MYDVAILGGGISGLYLAHRLLKRDSKKKVVIIEKSRDVGGRIETHQDQWMSVEAGAGRIHHMHKRTLSIIRDLGLGSNLVEINNNIRFVREEDGSLVNPPHIDIMLRVAAASKKMSKESLIGKTLLELSMEVCGEEKAKAALSSFGYTTEFLKMNAYDAIALMGIIAKPQKYFVLGGGLSQLIERLKTRLLSMGCKFELGQEVVGIQECEGTTTSQKGRSFLSKIYKIYCVSSSEYAASQCVCTFPANNLLKTKFAGSAEYRHRMSEWKRIVKDSIYEGSLCRIYSVFPPTLRGSENKGRGRVRVPWFSGLGKLTMNNAVRMIIPIDEEKGVVMISYTDGAIADKWAKMESEKGIREVNRRLKEVIDAELNISIPIPKHTRIFHWSNGVGYWKVGADSAAVEKLATKGFDGMHFCGENYSAKNQQWIEGALDTADLVFKEMK